MSTEGNGTFSSWVEDMEVAAGQLVDRVKSICAEGSVRRLRIRSSDGELLLEMPLNVGAVAGGALTLAAPGLALVAAFAALVARAKIEVIRADDPAGGETRSDKP